MNETKQLRILLIEDNPGDAFLVEDYLKEAFGLFSYDWAQSLQDGLLLLKKNKYNIVLTDLGLPDSSGEATYLALLQTNLNIPIVIFTGINDEKIGLDSIKAGVDDFLSKDVLNAFILKRTILYAIERKETQLQLLQSEQKFRAIFENMAAASSLNRIVYENGKPIDYEIVDINPSYSTMMKLTGKMSSVKELLKYTAATKRLFLIPTYQLQKREKQRHSSHFLRRKTSTFTSPPLTWKRAIFQLF